MPVLRVEKPQLGIIAFFIVIASRLFFKLGHQETMFWSTALLLSCMYPDVYVIMVPKRLISWWSFNLLSPKISYHGSHMDRKTWKNWKTFSTQGKSQGIFKRLESQGILPKILEKWGNFSQFLFLFFFDFLIEVFIKLIK